MNFVNIIEVQVLQYLQRFGMPVIEERKKCPLEDVVGVAPKALPKN